MLLRFCVPETFYFFRSFDALNDTNYAVDIWSCDIKKHWVRKNVYMVNNPTFHDYTLSTHKKTGVTVFKSLRIENLSNIYLKKL